MAARDRAIRVLKTLQQINHTCPAHSPGYSYGTGTSVIRKEYAFEITSTTVRYGLGVTKELGMDLKNMNAKKVCVMTDETLSKLAPFRAALDSLHQHKVEYKVFDKVRVEPTDKSFIEAAEFARQHSFDAYVAVGGGSVIDTCKAANLYASDPQADFMDYVNAPVGKGKPITFQLKPPIAIPTTCGTGSEATGAAIFDLEEKNFKTGIADRALRPTLALVDPLHTTTLHERVVANSGFDVLCHALESYTALPYSERDCPSNPLQRPAYQGSNPISDVWALHALNIVSKYFKRAVYDAEDIKARSQMHLASTYAGIGFGNAGVHLCHGLSYPISGLAKSYHAEGYDVPHCLVPHGLSVVVTAPAVFAFTAPMNPERHLKAANILSHKTTTTKLCGAGDALADSLRAIMYNMKVVNGISALGYSYSDIPKLVEGTIPQKRVTKLSPRQHTNEDLAKILEQSLTLY